MIPIPRAMLAARPVMLPTLIWGGLFPPVQANLNSSPAMDTPPLVQLAFQPDHASAPDDTAIGPFPRTHGVAAQSKPVTQTLAKAAALNEGTLSAWVYLPEALSSGPANTSWHDVFASLPGVCELSLEMSPQAVAFYFRWRGQQESAPSVRFQVPGLPGPGWHHVAAVWNIPAGYHNLYVDGQPAQGDTARYWDDLPTPAAREVKAGSEHLGLWNVRLYDRVLSPGTINRELTQLYRGASDYLLGARPLGKLQADPGDWKLVYSEDFTQTDQRAQWVLEGPGELSYSPEGLLMRSRDSDTLKGHIVYWLNRRLPENFAAQWKVRIQSPFGLNIVFFSASGPRGESIFDDHLQPRDGDFKQYHSGDINCYHISYYANTPFAPGRATCNLRKNAGFYLVANGPQYLSTDAPFHEVTLIKQGGSIQLAVDGNLSILWVDNGKDYGPILGGGWFGLRQMKWTEATYRDLRIYELP